MTEVNRPQLSNLSAMRQRAAEQKEATENCPVDPETFPRGVLHRVLKYLASGAGVPFTKSLTVREMADAVNVN